MLSILSAAITMAPAPSHLPKLIVQGANLVDPAGKVVKLKGANLGNWQVIEFWMLGNSGQPGIPKDQYALEQLLTKRFGAAENERLMDTYRASWIQKRDFQILKSYKFNLVRLPMNYRLMEDDAKPFQLKASAFKWIDRAVDLAEASGMYILLDMHGAQGGQSPYDHTGHSDQNHLKDSPEAQKRLAWLWGKLASRYKDRTAVVAYDVMNEPYGTPKPIQVSVFDQAYKEIRKNDPEKLIFAHGHYDGFSQYGDPKEHGWKNVGFQMHYYPGLFGGGAPTIKTHLQHFESLKVVAAKVKKLNVPFIIGEMNVVFDAAGGADMMRKYFDVHAGYGWMTTMWSYKVMSKEGGVGSDSWGCAANADPLTPVNFETDSKEKIDKYMAAFGTQRLAINEPLRKALSTPNYRVKNFVAPAVRTTAPQDRLESWTISDIGGALIGGLRRLDASRFDLYGGGADVWGARDEFRFVHQTLIGDGSIEVTVRSVEAVDPYTKAGLMLRDGVDATAPFTLLSIFPNGEVDVANRAKKGEDVVSGATKKCSFPDITIRITRSGGTLIFARKVKDGSFETISTEPDFLSKTVEAGVIALSHSSRELVKIGYQNLIFKQ